MFVLEKLVSRLLFPVPLTVGALLAGLAAILAAKRTSRPRAVKRIGVGLLTAATVFLWLAATPPIADAFLWSLERRYAPEPELPETVEYIVVLGSGHSEHEELGVWHSLGGAARARVAEGLRLSRGNTASVVFTGYEGGGEIATARMGRDAAVELGLDPERARVYPDPRNTDEEAKAVADMLAARRSDGSGDPRVEASGAHPRVALVTSASHMPRAVYLFERAGVPVAPMPTDYRGVPGGYSPWNLFPGAGALRNTERAWYEYMGLAWARVQKP